jgi:hypothetical protein
MAQEYANQIATQLLKEYPENPHTSDRPYSCVCANCIKRGIIAVYTGPLINRAKQDSEEYIEKNAKYSSSLIKHVLDNIRAKLG